MNKKILHYFQQDAVTAIIESLKKKQTPYVNAVTGFGKSLVMAHLTELALKKNKTVLQLVPNHTLCEQNYKQTYEYISEPNKIGICCAKLKRHETNKQCVIATQTSIVRRIKGLSFNVCLIDEADLVGIDDDNTYRKILAELKKNNPAMVIAGLTGSPYRQDQGMIHQGDNAVFTECCYESDIPRLIIEGYLSSVVTLNTPVHVDLDGVKIVKGEYDQTECGVRFHKIVDDAVQDFKRLFKENEIKTALIFASTIANGQRIVDQYGDDSECRLAHGGMTTHQRAEIIRWLTEGKGNRYLVNVGLYTRGFDFPELQCLVLLRATESMRLYVQILGRVLRTHEEKEYGYLIDYGTNVERFGPIDQLKPPKEPGNGEAPYKLCLECGTQNRLAAKACKECEAVFITLDDESGKYTMKTKAQVIQEREQKKWEYIDNPYLTFELAFSKKDGTPMVKMKVHDKFRHVMDYYICIEHKGRAGKNAVNFMFSILKDQNNFMELSKNAVLTAENLALLFSMHYDKYFKKMNRIVIGPGEGQFKEIKGVSYENY